MLQGRGKHSQYKEVLEIGEVTYGWRHLVENYFRDLKDLRRITMHSDKTGPAFMIRPMPVQPG